MPLELSEVHFPAIKKNQRSSEQVGESLVHSLLLLWEGKSLARETVSVDCVTRDLRTTTYDPPKKEMILIHIARNIYPGLRFAGSRERLRLT